MTYLLCWIAAKHLDQITTTTTLEQTLAQANQGCEYSLAKIVRLNWMIQHVKIHGVIKPIWCRDENFQTIVGDTRVIAARLAGLINVPVFAYLQQPQGQVVSNQQEILTLSGLQGGEILYRDSSNLLIDPPVWIEISHPSTRGHGHDQQMRLQAVKDLMIKQPAVIDKNWIMTPRDWGTIFQ